MRVSEAKKKWCPFADYRYGESVAHQGEYYIPKCIADGCMAWVNKAEYTDIKKIEVRDNEDRDKKLLEINISKEHVLISNKSKLYTAVLTYGVLVPESTGYCKRLEYERT